MTRFSRNISLLACVLLLSSLTGCASFHFPFQKKMPKASASDPAVQIICLWQQADGRDPDGRPCKGFQSQILFLSNKAGTPVQVDGTVKVYLFDDQGTEEEQTKPLRVFEFDSGSWNVHLTETTLGATYGVFIPYTRTGTKDANCALQVRLQPKRGPIVSSELSNMPLNANRKSTSGDQAKPITTEDVDQQAVDALSAKLLRTTTISMKPVPKSVAEAAAAMAKNQAPANPVSQAAHQVSQASNQISQASHQVVSDAPKESPESDRIRELEARVQQLLEQKSAPAVEPTPTKPAQRVPHPLETDKANPKDSKQDKPAAPAPDRLKWAPRQIPGTLETADEEPVELPRRKHLLDD